MEYQALYRKYRPQTFDDVIGQGHVTTTLAREVADGRVAHAYLFTGPRGTGKTTTARILAKALNCVNRGADGAPCNVCASCVAITEGSSLDVLELDAASHNSVDDIRDIKVSVTTVASSATSKRVFVLDEAHMLSKAAGNALLKTLEEPPRARPLRSGHDRALQAARHDSLTQPALRLPPGPDRGAGRSPQPHLRSGGLQDRPRGPDRHLAPCRRVGA